MEPRKGGQKKVREREREIKELNLNLGSESTPIQRSKGQERKIRRVGADLNGGLSRNPYNWCERMVKKGRKKNHFDRE